MAPVIILLVDDFEDARDIYAEYLTFKGYQVVLAADGAEALAQATAQRPDLILLDLRMPGRSGTEVMHVMRRDPALAGIPIIAFTAHALDEERRAALDAGFDAVLAKPCLPNELEAFIAATLRT